MRRFFSFFDLGVGIGAILFGQIAIFGYTMIYFTSGFSILLSMILYIYIILKEKNEAK